MKRLLVASSHVFGWTNIVLNLKVMKKAAVEKLPQRVKHSNEVVCFLPQAMPLLRTTGKSAIPYHTLHTESGHTVFVLFLVVLGSHYFWGSRVLSLLSTGFFTVSKGTICMCRLEDGWWYLNEPHAVNMGARFLLSKALQSRVHSSKLNRLFWSVAFLNLQFFILEGGEGGFGR